jgi:cell division inhibitor SepF
MSALRKAGVWLGLVEEEDETLDEAFDDDFGDEDEFVPPRPRALSRPTARLDRERDREPPRVLERPDRDLAPARDIRVPDRRVDYDPRPTTTRTPVPPTDRERERERERDRGTASVRPLTRPSGGTSGGVPNGTGGSGAYPPVPAPAPRSYQSGPTSFPTQDNLALAPQVQLRERAVVSDDSARRHQITTLHPTTYSEARTIGEHFRDGYPVIMNLTEMDEPDAKRLVDFAAGLAFGMRGSMERVTNRVFLLSPPNIHVSAEDKARIAEGGFVDRT